MVENPPGFVVRTEAQKAAWDNGYRLERGIEGGWLRYASIRRNRPRADDSYQSAALVGVFSCLPPALHSLSRPERRDFQDVVLRPRRHPHETAAHIAAKGRCSARLRVRKDGSTRGKRRRATGGLRSDARPCERRRPSAKNAARPTVCSLGKAPSHDLRQRALCTGGGTTLWRRHARDHRTHH